jgi:hypothetical protein
VGYSASILCGSGQGLPVKSNGSFEKMIEAQPVEFRRENFPPAFITDLIEIFDDTFAPFLGNNWEIELICYILGYCDVVDVFLFIGPRFTSTPEINGSLFPQGGMLEKFDAFGVSLLVTKQIVRFSLCDAFEAKDCITIYDSNVMSVDDPSFLSPRSEYFKLFVKYWKYRLEWHNTCKRPIDVASYESNWDEHEIRFYYPSVTIVITGNREKMDEMPTNNNWISFFADEEILNVHVDKLCLESQEILKVFSKRHKVTILPEIDN